MTSLHLPCVFSKSSWIWGIQSVPPQIGRAFKVMIEAAVVQIDGADNSLPVVTDKDLGMYEAGGCIRRSSPRIPAGICNGSAQGQRGCTYLEHQAG